MKDLAVQGKVRHYGRTTCQAWKCSQAHEGGVDVYYLPPPRFRQQAHHWDSE